MKVKKIIREVFLIRRGSVRHIVNQQAQELTGGTLVFIRPDDAHCYQRLGDNECQLVNLALRAATMSALFAARVCRDRG
jgi:AraC family cel operon transcriptional repressor